LKVKIILSQNHDNNQKIKKEKNYPAKLICLFVCSYCSLSWWVTLETHALSTVIILSSSSVIIFSTYTVDSLFSLSTWLYNGIIIHLLVFSVNLWNYNTNNYIYTQKIKYPCLLLSFFSFLYLPLLSSLLVITFFLLFPFLLLFTFFN
jgi:hypothetical protein